MAQLEQIVLFYELDAVTLVWYSFEGSQWETEEDTPLPLHIGDKKEVIEDISEDGISNIQPVGHRPEGVPSAGSNTKEQQDKKIEKSYTSIEEIKAQNVTIQSTVTFLSQNYDALQDRINQLETQLVTERETNLLHLQKLEDNLEKMERGAMSTCVEIRNIPVKLQESKESLAAMVTRIGSLINVPVQVHDVRDIFRTRLKDVDSRSIIVEFTTNVLKEKFIYMQRKFNKANKLSTEHLRLGGPAKPVFVSGNLTPKMKRLFFLARDFASSNQYRYCWVTNGKIYLREKQGAPHIMIKSESDLPKK
ncbi:unnamed protein product [Arctia plantaginis]|uniref:FP protein C-terminal domain-containing protein n=1 Tax=Arctia plantaginis TaxID=874455 RepID=A0A8S1AYJ8_ARCPL|nr:unnamed protein product [Arctia plantaginis]